MHARVWEGRAPPGRVPVVLVHGFSLSSLYWAPTAERLAREFPVFAPDLPGFGRSDAFGKVLDIPELTGALRAWMDALALGRVILVAHSFGCPVATEFALRHPARVERLVLADPAVDPAARTALQQIWRLLRDLPREPPSFWALLARDAGWAGPWRMARTLRFMLRDRLEEKLPHVRAPALVVRGARDALVSQDWAERAADLLPDGRLALIPGAPHVVPYAAPEDLVHLVRPFLLGTE